MTDVLHCYEEGLNTQVNAALMDYGNPILVERLQAMARRYDGFLMTPAENGKRKFAGSFFNDQKMDTTKQLNAQYGYMMLHAGLVLLWYNGSPDLAKLMTEFYDGNPDRYAACPPGKGWPKDLPRTLYALSGDRRFITDTNAAPADPWLARMLNSRECSSNVLDALARNPRQYELAGTLELGDSRPFPSYVAWHCARDKDVLLPSLEAIYKSTYYILPLLTEIQQSADRVPIKKNLTDFMYLGGIPVSRFHTAPFFAVSYEGFTPNFAAMVLDDTPELMRWVGYSFEPGTQSGKLRVWNLAPGTYAVRQGVDGNGDDRIDGEAKAETMKLKRYEAIPVALPSRQLWIVQAECLDKATPLHQRCDLAVSAEDALLEEGSLTVVAHIIGCKPTGPFRVEVADASGKVLARQDEPAGLDGAANLADRSKAFVFPGTFRPPLKISVTGPEEEITECNNSAILPATGSDGGK